MKPNMNDIRLSKIRVETDKKVVNRITLISLISLFLLLILCTEAKAKLTAEQYDLIKSGEIFYKKQDGTYTQAIGLDTKVSMNITGIVNRVRVEQTFKNPENFWTEGLYLFPLPQNAAVDTLKMKVGELIIEGEIKEKLEAKKIYEEAKKAGKKASLVEQQRPNLFTTSVANISPKGEITVIIEYQQKVTYDNDNFSIKFPMVAAQRYIPMSSNGIPVKKEDNKLIQSVENKYNPVDRNVELNISLTAGFDVNEIKSSYHKIDVKKENEIYKIKFADYKVQADNEFELVWNAKKTQETQFQLYTQKKENREFGLLMITPENDVFKTDKKPAREIIFIIDSSGSMGGTSMQQAKQALRLAIKRLDKNDRFNIIDFDTKFKVLFPSAQYATNNTLLEANSFINKLRAEGGTNAFEPIRFALNSIDEYSKDFLRQVVFITDGQISNEEDIFKEIKYNLDFSKLFTVSIGSAPNSFFMRRAASYGKGTFTHIGDENEVTKKMGNLFKKLESPSLTDIKINGLDLTISDLYFGETIFYSFESDFVPSQIEITANTINGKYSKTIDTQVKKEESGLDKLWARNIIEMLMNDYYITYEPAKKDEIKSLVTNLGLSFNLVTNFTSLVAVDKTPSRLKEEILKTKKVETKIPKGSKMYDANIPQTATDSNLMIFVGLVMLLASIFFLRMERREYEK